MDLEVEVEVAAALEAVVVVAEAVVEVAEAAEVVVAVLDEGAEEEVVMGNRHLQRRVWKMMCESCSTRIDVVSRLIFLV